jgi:coproporphyrinogen III oxidase
MAHTPLIDRAATFFQDLQDRICDALASADGVRFHEDTWQRPGGGGGRTRILTGGNIFEKAGVNFSDVHGEFRPEFAAAVPGSGSKFRATGISLVLHPHSPHVPTVHANFRRIEREDRGWFGGGADLTPYYLQVDDARHFHRTFKGACDQHDAGFYPRFKDWCDEYFFIAHRKESRGVGGIFFDYLGAGAEATAKRPPVAETALENDPERAFDFVKSAGNAFVSAYLPIVEKRRGMVFSAEEKRWQMLRRGRYVEFNLIYDRGTIFGLKTDGRVESILMSLPLEARWEYSHAPEPGSREAALLDVLMKPTDWV